MNGSKRFQKMASLITLVLCLVFAAILVFTFAACDDTEASGEPFDEGESVASEGLTCTFAPVDYDMVDTETVIEPEIKDEGERAVRTSDYDEYGCATCTYYYPFKHYSDGYDGDLYDYSGDYTCGLCEGPCEGHDYYITKGGLVRDIRMAMDTRVLEAEDGSTDINSKIRASLLFNMDAGVVNYKDYYYDQSDIGIEVSSLTGEPLEVESVEIRQYVYYKNTSGSIWYAKWTEYHSESGIAIGVEDYNATPNSYYIASDATDVYIALSLSDDNASGQYVFSITLAGGKTYSFDYWIIMNSPMLGAEVVYVD